jgi:peptide/nickel transport system substrate-binding protein
MAVAHPSSSVHGIIIRACLGMAFLIGLTGSLPHRVAAQTRAASFIDDGTLNFASDLLADNIDPADNESEYGDTIIRNVDETLIRLAGSSLTSYEPDLATSWSHNADSSVWTVHLRHGVRFHTGRCCMTADDVRYSYGRSAGAGLGGSYMLGRFLTDKNPLDQIKVIDNYTVEFDLHRPQPLFVAAMAQDYNALILDAQALRAHIVKGDWGHAYATRHDLGTGPYAITQWQADQQIVLARFPQYWAGWNGRHFSKIVISQVPDSTTRRELIEKGSADLTFDLTPQDYDQLRANPNVRITAPYATEIIYMTMTQSGPLASPLARQALSYAFPYDAFIKGIYRGYAKRAYGPIPASLLGYDPTMFHYTYDPAKARALFQQAGVKPGTTLTLSFEDAFPYPQAAELLQASLAQFGIKLQLQQLDEAAFNNVFYSTEPANKRPNLMIYAWWPDYNDPYDMAVTLVASYEAPPNGSNGGLYHDKQVDALLAQMENGDTATIIKASKQLQDITGRVDPPSLWLAEPAQAVALAATLQGYIANPVELRTFYFYTMYHS